VPLFGNAMMLWQNALRRGNNAFVWSRIGWTATRNSLGK
jgi:hypothetical protein